jgi:hypothetical protein
MSNTGLTDFGQCWSCIDDLTSPAVMVSGNRAVAEAVLRRWGTSPGELIDDPDYGFNLSDLISDDLGPSDIALAQQQAGAEAEKDQRVLSATVTLTLNNETGILTVNALIETATGPFTLVASVSAVGTQLLLVSP